MGLNYFEKLKDPRWQKKRLKIFERDNWQCQSCGKKEETLVVHHKFYTSKDPWDEPEENLATLCSFCHSFETVEGKLLLELINNQIKSKFFASDLLDIHYIFSLETFLNNSGKIISTAIYNLLKNQKNLDSLSKKKCLVEGLVNQKGGR
jgi:hypothetical protein